jgi:hypothetical protein
VFIGLEFACTYTTLVLWMVDLLSKFMLELLGLLPWHADMAAHVQPLNWVSAISCMDFKAIKACQRGRHRHMLLNQSMLLS